MGAGMHTRVLWQSSASVCTLPSVLKIQVVLVFQSEVNLTTWHHLVDSGCSPREANCFAPAVSPGVRGDLCVSSLDGRVSEVSTPWWRSDGSPQGLVGWRGWAACGESCGPWSSTAQFRADSNQPLPLASAALGVSWGFLSVQFYGASMGRPLPLVH